MGLLLSFCICKEKSIFHTDQSWCDKKIAFSYQSKIHHYYYTRWGIFYLEKINLHLKGYKLKIYYYFYKFVKQKRTYAKLTQPELAEKAGVGLRFLRELEQGKESLRLDKVNQVLQLFGYKVGAVQLKVEEDEKGWNKNI